MDPPLNTDQLQEQILHLDSKFQRACSQVLLLNNLVQGLQRRYDRAVRDNLRTYRYALRLRLCTAEGMRNMFYEYASKMADDIEGMENRMRQMGVEPLQIYDDPTVSEEDEEEDDDDSEDVVIDTSHP